MKIEIIDNNAFQSIEETNSVIWKMYYNKRIKTLLKQLIICLIILTVGILTYGRFERYTAPDKTIYYDLHIYLSLGIIYSISLLLSFRMLLRQKKMHFKNAKETALRNTYGSNQITITIDEETIKYTNASLKKETKWVLYSKYKVYENILFLYGIDEISFTIEKKLLSESDFNELMNFIKNKIVETK